MLGRSPIGPLEYTRRLWLRLWLLAVFVFLYAPIVILVVFSFNDSRRNIVWQGFTLGYYERALNNASLLEAFANSLVVALVSTLLSTVIGALLALALWRFRFPGRRLLMLQFLLINMFPVVLLILLSGLMLVAEDKMEELSLRQRRLRVIDAQVARLEREIDAMNDELSPLRSFVLPGGTPAAAFLHLARTVTRRAERLVVALAENEAVNPAVLRYLNRLSDHLFVLARFLNEKGARDVLWVPGANR